MGLRAVRVGALRRVAAAVLVGRLRLEGPRDGRQRLLEVRRQRPRGRPEPEGPRRRRCRRERPLPARRSFLPDRPAETGVIGTVAVVAMDDRDDSSLMVSNGA